MRAWGPHAIFSTTQATCILVGIWVVESGPLASEISDFILAIQLYGGKAINRDLRSPYVHNHLYHSSLEYKSY